jgi:hypothetical protein
VCIFSTVKLHYNLVFNMVCFWFIVGFKNPTLSSNSVGNEKQFSKFSLQLSHCYLSQLSLSCPCESCDIGLLCYLCQLQKCIVLVRFEDLDG